jgi:RNA polymerase sigma-70 factor (ECF subfamily)
MGGHQPEQTDADILQGLRLREISAVEKMTERYGQALTRAAFMFLNDAEAAGDVVQDALIAAWDGAHRVRDGTALRPWLFGVLFNLCRKHRRSLLRRLRRERTAGRRIGDSRRQTDDYERLEVMREALQRLDEELRTVLILRYEQGLSVSQTAEALGLPEGTVKSRTFAAIQKMRIYMGQHDE